MRIFTDKQRNSRAKNGQNSKTEEFRAAAAQRMREKWSDPVYREKALNRNRYPQPDNVVKLPPETLDS